MLEMIKRRKERRVSRNISMRLVAMDRIIWRRYMGSSKREIYERNEVMNLVRLGSLTKEAMVINRKSRTMNRKGKGTILP